MLSRIQAVLLPLCAVAGVLLLSSPAALARPDPADPKAAVPAATYLSPLRSYQSFEDTAPAPWRETNERVRQRGGWRAYAREAREPEGAASAASAASAPMPADGGHAGHRMK